MQSVTKKFSTATIFLTKRADPVKLTAFLLLFIPPHDRSHNALMGVSPIYRDLHALCTE